MAAREKNTVSGFTRSTKAMNIHVVAESVENPAMPAEEPRKTKNPRMKKSRRGRIFVAIWKCSEELESAKPARNPAISMERPIFPATAAMEKSHAKLTRKRSSSDLLIRSKSAGSARLPSQK